MQHRFTILATQESIDRWIDLEQDPAGPDPSEWDIKDLLAYLYWVATEPTAPIPSLDGYEAVLTRQEQIAAANTAALRRVEEQSE